MIRHRHELSQSYMRLMKLLSLAALSFILFFSPSAGSAEASAGGPLTVPLSAAAASEAGAFPESAESEQSEMETVPQFRHATRVLPQIHLKDAIRLFLVYLYTLSLLCSTLLALNLMAFRPIISKRIKRRLLLPVKFTSRFVVS